MRMGSLGGIKYGLNDPDNSLNLYDFGNNPAWLINDEKESWLKITPSFDKMWGDYKRLYDFSGADMGGLSFTGLKPLGENGTFLGKASYSFEQRKDVYRSLKINPYGGEAFFTADSTTGNFRYDGPRVGFAYSFELLPGLFTGVEANYGILDGMKNIYSKAKTLFRDVNGKAGLAYAVSNNIVLGVDFELFDSQESLEMQNPLSQTKVEIYNFRGETYSTFISDQTVNEKIRKEGKIIGSQVYFRPLDNLETALKAGYSVSGNKVLVPRQNIKEYEEGYSEFENYNIELRSRYQLFQNLTLGASIGHKRNDSWSRNSERDLLLWQWKVEGTILGAGTSYNIETIDLLLGIDYEARFIKADSSKFIDLRFHRISTTDQFLRLGAEYKLNPEVFLRAGYNYGRSQVDLIYGASNVTINSATLGFFLRIFDLADLDFMMQYGNMTPLGYTHYSRDHFSAAATVRLNTF